MTVLTSTDRDRLLAQLPELYALCPVECLPARVLAIAGRLIGGDLASFNEIELDTGLYRVLIDQDEHAWTALAPAFARHMHEHPVIAHVAATGDSRPYAISDFLRQWEFRRLALSGELFAPLGFTDQLSTTLQAIPGHRVVGLAINRAGHFTERDRLLLDALREHLITAYRNSTLYSHALGTSGVDEELSAHAGQALERLTPRQLEVLGLIADGCTNAQIALMLDMRTGTVKKHVEHILQRLQTPTRIAAARLYLLGSPERGSQDWWNIEGAARYPLSAA